MTRKASITLAVSSLMLIPALLSVWPLHLPDWANHQSARTVTQAVHEISEVTPNLPDGSLAFHPTSPADSKIDRKTARTNAAALNPDSPIKNAQPEPTYVRPRYSQEYLEQRETLVLTPDNIPIAPGYQSPVVLVDNNTGERIFIYPKEVLSRINPFDFAYACYLITTNFTWDERQRMYELTTGEIDAAERAEVMSILRQKLSSRQVDRLRRLAVKYGFMPANEGVR